MTAQSVLTAAALLIAVMALLRARRLARRLERIVESYWELRYDYGQLRAQMERLQGRVHDAAQAEAFDAAPGSAQAGTTAFVPLSSIKRT